MKIIRCATRMNGLSYFHQMGNRYHHFVCTLVLEANRQKQPRGKKSTTIKKEKLTTLIFKAFDTTEQHYSQVPKTMTRTFNSLTPLQSPKQSSCVLAMSVDLSPQVAHATTDPSYHCPHTHTQASWQDKSHNHIRFNIRRNLKRFRNLLL